VRRVLSVAVVVMATTIVGPPTRVRAAAPTCNGERVLCDRSLGDVAFATTHNSMASTADHFVPPNQQRGMRAQLAHGIRGFQIDAYFGTPRGDRVYTDLTGPLGDAAELPPQVVAAARRLHQRLVRHPPGRLPTCTSAVFCELGAVRMVDELRVVRDFLDQHPREVVLMVIEDYVPPDRILAEFRAAGLEHELLAVTPGTPLPTLEEMIDADTRLQVSLERGAAPPTLPNAFAGLVEETPFTFHRPRALEAPGSCAAHRGTETAPVFQFNHWVTPAEPVTARRVNSRMLRERVHRCMRQRGRGPTLVAVDFAERGDLLSVVEQANR
jgi:hypothetical protein